jgi:hypothetical protein
MKINPRRLIGLLALAAAVLWITGCAGPSRAQYARLLHECREANREHLRMLREYDGIDCRNDRGEPIGRPEQGAGTVEMGLGGY